MKDKQYHIDVTPEEDLLFKDVKTTPVQINSARFGKTFWSVLGLHLAVLSIVAASSYKDSNKEKIDLSAPVPEIPDKYHNQSTERQSNISSPSPTPATVKTETKNKDKKEQSKSQTITQTYVVKKGDTINSISKKFKLNKEKLLRINNIKDQNLIKVGQTLKFVP